MKNNRFERFEAFLERGGKSGVKEWIYRGMDVQKVPANYTYNQACIMANALNQKPNLSLRELEKIAGV